MGLGSTGRGGSGMGAGAVLGDGSTDGRVMSVCLRQPGGITAFAAGASMSLAIARDGALWGWGKNDHGQLGDGITDDRPTPVRLGHVP